MRVPSGEYATEVTESRWSCRVWTCRASPAHQPKFVPRISSRRARGTQNRRLHARHRLPTALNLTQPGTRHRCCSLQLTVAPLAASMISILDLGYLSWFTGLAMRVPSGEIAIWSTAVPSPDTRLTCAAFRPSPSVRCYLQYLLNRACVPPTAHLSCPQGSPLSNRSRRGQRRADS